MTIKRQSIIDLYAGDVELGVMSIVGEQRLVVKHHRNAASDLSPVVKEYKYIDIDMAWRYNMCDFAGRRDDLRGFNG